MRGSPFFYFLTLSFFKDIKSHIGVVVISAIVLLLLSSTLFVSSSIRYSLLQILETEPDFVVQKIRGGQRVDMPAEWMDKILQVHGVEKVTPRVYGRYYFEEKKKWGLVIGVDFLDENSNQNLKKIIDNIDLKKFLGGDKMLIGRGVTKYLKNHFYYNEYNFLTPKGEYKKVDIFESLPVNSSLVSNDMMIMPIELAKEILGINKEMVSDIAFNVPNEAEWDNIASKVATFHYDIRLASKLDVKKSYESLYNYKSGLFLILFLIVLSTFVLILYQKYSVASSTKRREIGLFRAMGWSMSDVLWFKFYEALFVIIISFVLGVGLGYLYVFVFDAPLLREIFLGGANLSHSVSFVPVLDIGVLSSIFLIYAVSFAAAVLIPVWKIATSDPKEAMQ